MITTNDPIEITDQLTLSRATCVNIASAHVRQFQSMLDRARAGEPGYRLDECEGYLATWRAALTSLQSDEVVALGQDAKDEIVDALTSGDYDDHLTESEQRAVAVYRGDDL